MQLQLERQRQRGLHQYHSLAGVSSNVNNDHSSAAAAPGAIGMPGAANGGIVVTSNSIGGVSTSHPMTMGPMGSHLWTNVTSSSKGGGGNNVSGPGASAASGTCLSNSNGSNGTFMLSQVSDDESSDYSLEERKKRELFVEELVLASLANTKLHNNHDDDS